MQEYEETDVHHYMEHIDVYVSMDGLQGRAMKFFTRDEARNAPHNLRFALRYRKGYLPSYLYQEETNTYKRYYNWEPMLDANGQEVTCSNVIIMDVNLKWLNDRDDQPKYNLLRGGKCEYFIGGTHFTGTFEKERISKNTRYYDEDGNLVRFLPGKTFIQLVDEDTGFEIIG